MIDRCIRHLRGVHFDDTDLLASVMALVDLRCSILQHEPTGIHLDCCVCDPPLDGLSLGKRHPESDALASMLGQHIECAFSKSERCCSHLEPASLQSQLHGGIALADLPQNAVLRNAAVREEDLTGVDRAEHWNFTLDDEARRSFLDDEGRDSLLALAFANASHHDREVGVAGVADPDLSSVEHPVVGLSNGSGLHCGGVAPGTGFRDRHRRSHRAFDVGL